MKSRLSTHDIVVLIQELKLQLLGLRVDQVYDIDKKTYIIRLAKTEMKKLLLIESGCRFHTTSFEWPKNPAPSGFTMKLRKHLNNKRLENISQIGADRVVDFQFGTEAFTFHVYLELYDKGNIILTDQHNNILSVVRPYVLGEDRIAAHEKYAVDKAKTSYSLTRPEVAENLTENPKKTIREIFLNRLEFGPALLSFVLKEQGLTPATKIPSAENVEEFSGFEEKLFQALERGRLILENPTELELGGFILINPASTKPRPQLKGAGGSEPAKQIIIYDQFHPRAISSNFSANLIIDFPTLDGAVDDFFSKVEAQKIDLKQVTQERDALNKLERVKADQRKRIDELKVVQEVDKTKAELIMFNQELIEKAIAIIRQLIANQLPWDDIWEQIKEAQQKGDPLACQITALNLIRNRFSMRLKDPYEPDEEEKQVAVELDLDLSAYANASKYYDLKKASAKKEERTFESQEKALKSTEKKTLTSLREVATIQSIKKARKVLWFEKFRWFISSENYLVLGGHDAQQNEVLVKRYLKPKDVYLHADSHGAPTIIIKNDSAPGPVMPKTLTEAGTLAVCASGAWDTKIVPSAWWVYGEQVSKSAPTGEYLPTGSFMIRGKKNFLPPAQLVLGFGFLFRLTEESMPRHANERPRRVHTSSSCGDDKYEVLERKNSLVESESSDEPLEDDEDENQFPDTKVELHLGRARTISTVSGGSSVLTLTEETAEPEPVSIITSGVTKAFSADLTQIRKNQKKDSKKAGTKGKLVVAVKQEPEPVPEQPADPQTTNKTKRGQHGRKKKLKEKYRFQDEEERELRMQLLQAKPKGSEPSTTTTNATPVPPPSQAKELDEKESEGNSVEGELSGDVIPIETKRTKPVQVIEPDQSDPIETAEMEINVLNALTGSPVEEDELLFAIPVIAPYSTLQNYKYKIKMIPGSNKRGKAARHALEIFIKDKQARQREKDLLKSVKDPDLAKNFPGKVKLAGGSDKK